MQLCLSIRTADLSTYVRDEREERLDTGQPQRLVRINDDVICSAFLDVKHNCSRLAVYEDQLWRGTGS